MVSRKVALKQVLRFENYANFPDSKDPKRLPDQEELISAFQEAAFTDQHAVDIGNWLMRRRSVDVCRFCPIPAEVYAAAEATRPQTEPDFTESESTGRQRGDEPFNGFADLVTPKLLYLMREKAENGRTHAERESAKALLRAFVPAKQMESAK